MVRPGDIWEVVGGGGKGGIVVRTGMDLCSSEVPERLETGAQVKALEYVDGRLHYKMLRGAGPVSGWISTSVKGKELAVKTTEVLEPAQPTQKKIERSPAELTSALKAAMGIQAAQQAPFFRPPHPVKSLAGGHRAPRTQCGRTKVLSLESPIQAKSPNQADAHPTVVPASDLSLCPKCHLPVGDCGYESKNGDGVRVHAECIAQVMVSNLMEDEEARAQEVANKKRIRRREYGIGWSVERIPRNRGLASKLGCDFVPQGMVCLVLQEDHLGRLTVEIAPTIEPAAAINLEYLMIALRVRRLDRRDPLFSLDPVVSEGSNEVDKKQMQVKRFEPKWLAGTSVGEVLFQADYHLKELSMGEYDQPVVGMKSSFDYSQEEGHAEEWTAREWFMVRKAEIQLSDDDVLIPCVKMGVEAREQRVGCNGMIDARVTRHDHPMVKYAEAFTRNFDLIAERKSVINQLRELTKATVMAKFLVDARVGLKDSWLEHSCGNATFDRNDPGPSEVPQLWNERFSSKILVKDGTLVDCDTGMRKTMHGVYGGADLAVPTPGAPPVPGAPAGVGAQIAVGGPIGVARRALGLKTRRAGARLSGPIKTISLIGDAPVPGLEARPRGVDLNLDEFDLSAPKEVSSQAHAGSWAKCLEDAENTSKIQAAFWSGIFNDDEIASPQFDVDDKVLLRSIFNPHLSDRFHEGDRFTPPNTNSSYVDKLRNLVKQEEQFRKQRLDHFLSTSFAIGKAGPLFPSSWTRSFEVEHGQKMEHCDTRVLCPRPDYAVSPEALSRVSLAFDQCTEDGRRFRIYRPGTLEVRTVQDNDCQELVGAVFSVSSSTSSPSQKDKMSDSFEHEKVAKVTQYVERACRPMPANSCNYYVVFETETGNLVVSELLDNGSIAWDVNPDGAELRNSLAKVLTTTCCSACTLTIRDVKGHQAIPSLNHGLNPSLSNRKRYVEAAYSIVAPADRAQL